jgi:hypothetical protein
MSLSKKFSNSMAIGAFVLGVPVLAIAGVEMKTGKVSDLVSNFSTSTSLIALNKDKINPDCATKIDNPWAKTLDCMQ